MKVIKRTGEIVEFDFSKIETAIAKAAKSCGKEVTEGVHEEDFQFDQNPVPVELIQDAVEKWLMKTEHYEIAREYILYREKHKVLRDFVKSKIDFIEKYKSSSNTANATVDDNSNVGSKNIGVLNAEIHKPDNIQISRGMVMHKLKDLYPEFDSKQYVRDLDSHIIYKHDESSFSGAIALCILFLTKVLKLSADYQLNQKI